MQDNKSSLVICSKYEINIKEMVYITTLKFKIPQDYLPENFHLIQCRDANIGYSQRSIQN